MNRDETSTGEESRGTYTQSRYTAGENMSVKRKKTKTRTKTVPPDGGWGWVILFSAMLVNFLIPGTVKSFGVLFVEFLHVFKASSTAASWMPALCYFLYSSLGPLSSILSNKYSYKTVTLIGGAFAASGMMLSYFANSVTYLYISYGIMVGIGAGLSFPPTVYIVTQYFEKLRGLANGLCISGSAIGTIVLPPFLQYLLDCFGYRGAVLIMGAITLNTLICGLLYHPVEQHMKIVQLDDGIDNEALTLDEPVKRQPDEKIRQSASSLVVVDLLHKVVLESTNEVSSEKPRKNDNAASQTDAIKETPREEIERTEDGDLDTATSRPSSKENDVPQDDNGVARTVSRRGSAEGGIKERLDTAEPAENSRNDTGHRKPADESPKSTERNPERIGKRFWKTRFDLSVLRDPVYLVILISNSTSAISNTNFMILLPSYAINEGIDKNRAALLLSVVSALDLVGRIGGASLSDIDFIPKYYYFVGGLGTSGIALALLPMATSYTMLSFFCGLFGLSSGMYIGITTVILADMLGTEKLSSSYGISLFVNGVLQLVGPPVCGVIFEHVGSYKPIFLAFGIILILGTALWAVMPIIKRNNKKDVEAM